MFARCLIAFVLLVMFAGETFAFGRHHGRRQPVRQLLHRCK